MINYQCFEENWILDHSNRLNCKELNLEKAIIALQLLSYLAESDLSFQFKGGTSLLLRLKSLRRLSIDIDIISQSTSKDIELILQHLSNQTPFLRFEYDLKRDKDNPPTKHYKIFYPSQIEPKMERNILLDVIFDPSVVPFCDPVLIKTDFIETNRELYVDIPTIEALLGDKLTAFAPKTIGILYDTRRSTDILKQLFDIESLFDCDINLNKVRDSYTTFHGLQCKYREINYSLAETIQDSITAGYLYSQIDLPGSTKSYESELLDKGVKELNGHLINNNFTRDKACIATGKMAFIASWILKKPKETSIVDFRYHDKFTENLRIAEIQDIWLPLNKIKPTNPEAFYYWYQAQQILNGKQIIS